MSYYSNADFGPKYDPTDPTNGDPSGNVGTKSYRKSLALGIGATALVGAGLGISKIAPRQQNSGNASKIDMSEWGTDDIQIPDLSEISKLPKTLSDLSPSKGKSIDVDATEKMPGRNVTSKFTNNALPDEFRGIKIFEHGGNLQGQEAADFMSHLGHLTENYPNLTDLNEIHLNHAGGHLPGRLGELNKASGEYYLNGQNPSGIAFRPEGIGGKGGILINVPESRSMEAGVRAGGGVAGGPSGVLAHEFGHHVEYDMAGPGSGYEGPALDALDHNYKGYRITPDSIGSKYAGANSRELFAETFSRAEMGGKGASRARAWEGNVRTAANRTSRAEKMAHHARFAEEQLKHM